MNGVSYHSLDAELLGLMYRAGFQLNLSLVSATDSVRRQMSRPHDLAKYRQVVDAASALGFEIVSYQILGLPGESLASMIETLCFAARLPVRLGASPYYRVPGSPLGRQGDPPSQIDLVRARLSALGSGVDRATRDRLYTLFVTTRILNFLKRLDVGRAELGFEELLERASQLDSRTQLGLDLLQRLLRDGQLFAATRTGLVVRERFDAELFRRVWNGTERLGGCRGGAIRLNRVQP